MNSRNAINSGYIVIKAEWCKRQCREFEWKNLRNLRFNQRWKGTTGNI